MIELPSGFADNIASSTTAWLAQIGPTLELIIGVLVGMLALSLLLGLFRH